VPEHGQTDRLDDRQEEVKVGRHAVIVGQSRGGFNIGRFHSVFLPWLVSSTRSDDFENSAVFVPTGVFGIPNWRASRSREQRHQLQSNG
jgi:hypothetical protein